MRIKIKQAVLLPVLALLLFSCVNTYKPTVKQKYQPKPDTYEVQVIEGYTDRPHKRFGMIETDKYFEMDTALKMLKKSARKAGADAVMNVKYVDSSGVVSHAGNAALWASGMRAVGEAVVFTDTKETVVAPEAPVTVKPSAESTALDEPKAPEEILSEKAEIEPKERSIKGRLIYLKGLYEEDLINEDEYRKKRSQILDQL